MNLEHSISHFPLCKPCIIREQCTLWRHSVCDYVLKELCFVQLQSTVWRHFVLKLHRRTQLRFVLLYCSLRTQWHHTVLYNWTMHAFLCFNCLLQAWELTYTSIPQSSKSIFCCPHPPLPSPPLPSPPVAHLTNSVSACITKGSFIPNIEWIGNLRSLNMFFIIVRNPDLRSYGFDSVFESGRIHEEASENNILLNC